MAQSTNNLCNSLNLVANISVGRTRREQFNGRECIVCPVSMLVPGVLNGSKGPLYYPPEEVAKNVDAWNGMPIVVYHPIDNNGLAVSARSKELVERSGIGTIFGARIHNGKLKALAYFDVERTRRVDDRIYQSLVKNNPIELSTGLFTDNTPAQSGAHHNGQPYQYVARNYRPDHLAVLPDQVGACSLKDGCGVLVNTGGNSSKKGVSMQLTVNQKKTLIEGLVGKCGCYTDRVLNKLDNDDLVEIGTHNKLIVDGKLVENSDEEDNEEDEDEYEEDEDDVTGNCDEEEPEDTTAPTTKTLPMMKKKKKPAVIDNKKGGEQMPTRNSKPAAMTEEEWFSNAPLSVRATFNHAREVETAERIRLTSIVTSNARNSFSADQLQSKDLPELRALARLAEVPVSAVVSRPLMFGAAVPMGPTGNAGNPVKVDSPEYQQSLPVPPTINFGELAKSQRVTRAAT